MTVKRLIEILQEAPQDMRVYVLVHNEGGAFGFAEACEGETGECELGPPAEELYNKEWPLFYSTDRMKVFGVLPHGFGTTEDDHTPDHINN